MFQVYTDMLHYRSWRERVVISKILQGSGTPTSFSRSKPNSSVSLSCTHVSEPKEQHIFHYSLYMQSWKIHHRGLYLPGLVSYECLFRIHLSKPFLHLFMLRQFWPLWNKTFFLAITVSKWFYLRWRQADTLASFPWIHRSDHPQCLT